MTHGIEYGTQLNDNVVGGFTNADLDRMKAAGARWVRINFDMAFIWPGTTNALFVADTPDYATGADSARITYAKSIGLKVLGELTYCPQWLCYGGGTYPGCPPSDFSTFATMCARAYRDHHTDVDAWSVWNEPNNAYQFWIEPTGGPNRYRELLRAVVLAMRTEAVALGQSWGTPQIWSGGASPGTSSFTHFNDRWDHGSNPVGVPTDNMSIGTFLDYLFDNTLGIVPGTANLDPYVDGYSIHPYVYNPFGTVVGTQFENPLMHAFTRTVNIGTANFAYWDDIICAHEGYSNPAVPPTGFKKIHATESGWPGTDGLYTVDGSEFQVGGYFDQIAAQWEQKSYSGAGVFIWAFLRDDPTGAADLISQYGGLLHADSTPKAVRSKFATHAAQYAPPGSPGGVVLMGDSTVLMGSSAVLMSGGLSGSGPPPPPVNNTLPVIKYEMGISPRADSGPWFVIGDVVRGKLDGAYGLAPRFWYYDIGDYVEGCSSVSGRNQYRGRTQSGTMSWSLENKDRRFDRRNTSGPYYPGLKPPNMRMRITVDGVVWQTCTVRRLDPGYAAVNISKATMSGNDALADLARTDVVFNATAQDAAGRINHILDCAGYTGARSIGVGAFNMGSYPVSAKALDEIGAIAEAEDTLFYCAPDSTLVFLPRASLFAAPIVTFDDGQPGVAGSVPYKSITYEAGVDLFANQITVTRRAADSNDHPVTQSYSDNISITEYGGTPTVLDFPNSPVDNDFAAFGIANNFIGPRYAQPFDRISSVTLDLADFDPSTRVVLALLGQGGACRVIHRPPGGGSPATTDQMSVVIGRSLNVANRGSQCLVTYWLHAMDGGI